MKQVEPTERHIKKSLRNYKLILLWNDHSGKKYWHHPEIAKPNYLKKLKCPETRCRFVFSHQKEKYPFSEYDVILFDIFRLLKRTPIPEEKLPHQLYIFYTTEAPAPWWQRGMDSSIVYNIITTWKSTSDIWTPFIRFTDKKTGVPITPTADFKWRKFDGKFTNKKFIRKVKKRKKNIVAVISHCGAHSRRDDLIKKLKKFIDIDVYGRCGNLKCPIPHNINLQCDNKLGEKYKFYAAFENKLCADYITEKIFHGFSRNMIPIVYGGSNYSRFAPPHSFIDVGDFKDFKELGKYIKFLSKSTKEYVKYFWWQKYYKVRRDGLNFCKLCDYLHTPGVENRDKKYDDIKQFWYDDACVNTVKNMNSSIAKKLLSGSTKNLKKNIKRCSIF